MNRYDFASGVKTKPKPIKGQDRNSIAQNYSFYQLDELNNVSPLTSGKFGGDFIKTIQKTDVGNAEVSTVFLGVNHRHEHDMPPLVFETKVFGGEFDSRQWRCTTLSEAELQHEIAIKMVKGEIK